MVLCTDLFTLPDVVMLMNVLRIKWDIPSTIQYCNGLPRIYIASRDMDKVRAVVMPHMHPFFYYKVDRSFRKLKSPFHVA